MTIYQKYDNLEIYNESRLHKLEYTKNQLETLLFGLSDTEAKALRPYFEKLIESVDKCYIELKE
jgi:hypothetical protein